MTHPALVERRRRIQRIRARVAAGAAALFIAVFGGLYVQMASGNDPAPAASSAQVATASSGSAESSGSPGSPGSSSSDDSSAMTTQAS